MLAKNYASTNLAAISNDVKKRLKRAKFEIVGSYSPYPKAEVIVISNKRLRQVASLSENGVYAAIQRVSVTTTGKTTQVSFTNPVYIAHAYRLKKDLSDISKRLKKTLGFIKEFGSEKGLTKSRLREYQYQWMMMPNFVDRLELAEYSDQKTAVRKVLATLNNNTAGVSKVYQVTLKSKNTTVIGVKMAGKSDDDCSGDNFIMQIIDSKKLKGTAHLPYELIITDGVVNALFAEFRIAMNFPDLTMLGKNSFSDIMCAPAAISDALTIAAGGEPDDSW